ncbi:MAG: TfoX/Sxy family protein [Actinobacteria bacterium]|uniref:TfoX/Sxy family protein n=1 Tax=Nostocoides veronense TaxID=330836 RepID=A0ABN2LAK5_9MICO|nr:TfoX/Sxy family protein [Actinomycetota bacterium]
MAYDRELAERIRGAISGVEGVQEKAMFGGLAFLVDGHMAIAAGGKGHLMARVDPADGMDLVERPGVHLMEMGGRSMTGWLHVDQSAVDTETALSEWVDRGVTYVRTLPPKAAAKKPMGRKPRA